LIAQRNISNKRKEEKTLAAAVYTCCPPLRKRKKKEPTDFSLPRRGGRFEEKKRKRGKEPLTQRGGKG